MTKPVCTSQKVRDVIRQHLERLAEIFLFFCDVSTNVCESVLMYDVLCSVTMKTSWNCYHIGIWSSG